MPSFDIVSQVNIQEVKNAVDQALKEIQQRFDFRGSKSAITLEEVELTVVSDDDYKLKSVLDILQTKLVKRGVSLKSLEFGAVQDSLGGTRSQKITLQQGIPQEKAKDINRLIRDSRLKVQAQIQGDQIRVSGKNKDDLQSVIALLREKDLDLPLEFTNYR
jgi:cyclic-di-GMP-binding protein